MDKLIFILAAIVLLGSCQSDLRPLALVGNQEISVELARQLVKEGKPTVIEYGEGTPVRNCDTIVQKRMNVRIIGLGCLVSGRTTRIAPEFNQVADEYFRSQGIENWQYEYRQAVSECEKSIKELSRKEVIQLLFDDVLNKGWLMPQNIIDGEQFVEVDSQVVFSNQTAGEDVIKWMFEMENNDSFETSPYQKMMGNYKVRTINLEDITSNWNLQQVKNEEEPKDEDGSFIKFYNFYLNTERSRAYLQFQIICYKNDECGGGGTLYFEKNEEENWKIAESQFIES